MPKAANSSVIQNKFFEIANIFVDRDEPRKNFWEIYNNYRAKHTNDPLFVQILAYYGIGGVGKTKLLHKIATELDNNLTNKARHIYFDFNDSQNPIEVLSSIKNILIKKYKFEFPLFELGQYALAQKNGQDMKAPEAKSFLDKSPSLGILLEVAGVLPVADLCAKLVKVVDSSVSLISNIVKKHKISVQAVNTLEPQELRSYLPQLFAKDLNDNIEKNDDPLVIFLDTYEQLVNEAKDGNTIHFADEWLKGERGLVLNCHNVLWVVAGRERLKWIDLDADWEGTLIQYSLGQFSEIDSIDYLRKAGIEDYSLCEQLSKLTSGVPIHLSLCVDVYNRIKENNGIPTINDFGNSFENLIPLFLKRLENESERLLVYMLSCIQMWDDALVKYVANGVLKGDWESSYRRLKVLSFITDTHDGKYNMHQTVSASIRRSPGVEYQAIREQIEQKSIEYATSRLKNLSVYDPEYGYWLLWSTKFIVSSSTTEESIENQFAKCVYPYWNKLLDIGIFDLALNTLDLMQYNDLRQGNSWYLANVLSLRALVFDKKKDDVSAIKIGHDATKMYRSSPKVKNTEFGYKVLDSLTTLMYSEQEEFYLRIFLLDLCCDLFSIDDSRIRENITNISSIMMLHATPDSVSQEEINFINQKIELLENNIRESRRKKIIQQLQEMKNKKGFLNKEAISLTHELSTISNNNEESIKLRNKCISLCKKIIEREKSVDNYETFSEICSAYKVLCKCDCNNKTSIEKNYLSFLNYQANKLLITKPTEDTIRCLQLCYNEFPSLDSKYYAQQSILISKTLQHHVDFYGEDAEETSNYVKKILNKTHINEILNSETYCRSLDLRIHHLKKEFNRLQNISSTLFLPSIKIEEEICNLLWGKAKAICEDTSNAKKIYDIIGDTGINLHESLLKHRIAFYGNVLENRSVLYHLITLYNGKGFSEKVKEYQSMLEETVVSYFTKRWEMRQSIYGESIQDKIEYYLYPLAFHLSLGINYKKSIETYDKIIQLCLSSKIYTIDKLDTYYHGILKNIERLICSEENNQELIDSWILKYLVNGNYVPTLKDLASLIDNYQKFKYHSSIPYMDEAINFTVKFDNFIDHLNKNKNEIALKIESYDCDDLIEDHSHLLENVKKIQNNTFFPFLNQYCCWLLGKLCSIYAMISRDEENFSYATEYCEQRKITDYKNSVLDFVAYISLLENYEKMGKKEETLLYANLLLELLRNPDSALLSEQLFQVSKIYIGNWLTKIFFADNQYNKSLDSANTVMKMIQDEKEVNPEQKSEAEQLLQQAKEKMK